MHVRDDHHCDESDMQPLFSKERGRSVPDCFDFREIFPVDFSPKREHCV